MTVFIRYDGRVKDTNGPVASKETIINKIKEQSTFSITYFLLLITSTIIATLGLLTNNSSVVIGAMLIAPVFWPVLGISLGSVKNDGRVLLTTTISLFLTIGLVLLTSGVLTIILPFEQLNGEIISRTQPTLIHLFIALTSSVVGIAALYFKRISPSASGAAISIALLPPLCVSGIGLATKNWSVFLGAGLLFVTSTTAIIFAGIVSLYFFKIRPYFKKDKTIAATSFAISLFFLFILSIPLTWYLSLTVKQSQLKNTISQIFKKEVAQINTKAQAENITVTFPNVYDSEQIEVEATLYVPESQTITLSHQQKILDQLSARIDSPIDLKLNIVETVELHKNGDGQQISNQVVEIVREYLATVEGEFQVNEINTVKEDDTLLKVGLQLFYTEQIPLSYQQKIALEEKIATELNIETILDIQLIATEEIKMEKSTNPIKSEIRTLLKKSYPDIIAVDTITLEESPTTNPPPITITLEITAPDDFSLTTEEKEDLALSLQTIIDSEEPPTLIILLNPVTLL